MKPLAGKVAVVAGATRGAGRGIARALGEAGATVYCTGRSTRGNPSPYGRRETIEETAALVDAAGGAGVAVRVDHADEAEVEALFARVVSEQGRIDLLADSVAGEDPSLGGWTPLVRTDLARGGEALRQALLTHLITAKHAGAAMAAKKRGLIVEVTEGDTLYGGGNPLTDLVKSGLKGLAVRLAFELRRSKVAAVAITPGFLRSESMLEHFGVTAEDWRAGGKKDPNFLESESPLFLGRAVAALAADKAIMRRSGAILSSWELAREYGFTDEDGSRPDWGAHFRKIYPSLPGFVAETRLHLEFLERMAERARYYLGEDGAA